MKQQKQYRTIKYVSPSEFAKIPKFLEKKNSQKEIVR